MLTRRRLAQGALALAPARGWATAQLRLGGFVVAPLLLGDEHQPIDGALPRFLRAQVAPRTGVALQFEAPMTYGRAMRSLREGELDVMLLVSGRQAESERVARSSWSYLRTQPTLVLRQDAPLRALASLEPLRGLGIGWNRHSAIRPEWQDLGVRWHLNSSTQWQASNLRMLAAGRFDAALFYNEDSPRYWIRKLQLPLRLLPLPLPAVDLHMAYSRRTPRGWIDEFDRLAQAAFQGPAFRQALDSFTD